MIKTFMTSLLIFCLTVNVFSQNGYTFSQFKDESIQFVQQPIKWNGNDWLKLGILGAGTFLAMQADQPVREMFQRNPEYKNSVQVALGNMYGELYSPVIIAGIFGLHNLFTQEESSKKIAYEILQTTLYAGAITTVFKLAFGRTRPSAEEGSKSFGNWSILDDSYHSFPSGHTSVAFSISTVLSKNAKTDFLKVIAYLPALLTAVARVYHDDHWASDVLLSGIIGYTVGEWVTSKHETKITFQSYSPRQLSLVISLN